LASLDAAASTANSEPAETQLSPARIARQPLGELDMLKKKRKDCAVAVKQALAALKDAAASHGKSLENYTKLKGDVIKADQTLQQARGKTVTVLETLYGTTRPAHSRMSEKYRKEQQELHHRSWLQSIRSKKNELEERLRNEGEAIANRDVELTARKAELKHLDMEIKHLNDSAMERTPRDEVRALLDDFIDIEPKAIRTISPVESPESPFSQARKTPDGVNGQASGSLWSDDEYEV
jgi:chromosome segregation ATPase